MKVQAPQGQYRVIGRGRIDTMDFPSEGFLFCQDYESLDEARAWSTSQKKVAALLGNPIPEQDPEEKS